MIPPPFAVVSLGVSTEPISMFLSSTVRVVELIVVVVPLTVRSPDTTRSLLTVTVPPAAEPRLIFVVEVATAPVPILIVLVFPKPRAPVLKFVVDDAFESYPRFNVVAAPNALTVVEIVSNTFCVAVP